MSSRTLNVTSLALGAALAVAAVPATAHAAPRLSDGLEPIELQDPVRLIRELPDVGLPPPVQITERIAVEPDPEAFPESGVQHPDSMPVFFVAPRPSTSLDAKTNIERCFGNSSWGGCYRLYSHVRAPSPSFQSINHESNITGKLFGKSVQAFKMTAATWNPRDDYRSSRLDVFLAGSQIFSQFKENPARIGATHVAYDKAPVDKTLRQDIAQRREDLHRRARARDGEGVHRRSLRGQRRLARLPQHRDHERRELERQRQRRRLRAALADLPSGRTATLPFRAHAVETRVKLVVLSGEREGLERPLTGKALVGADPSCDWIIDERGVSRRHAEFELKAGGRVWVRDLGSRNGTFLQGARIMEAELSVGSVVQLGETQIGLFPRWHVREVEPSQAHCFGELHGKSLALREVFGVLERVSGTEISLLIEGESGTGKELAARSVHRASPRAQRPYVVVDCTTVPKDLAESELFGHRRGSFSGAVADREGAFQRANGGTIFLDEIGELPSDIQPKLLRALETGEVRPVGASQHQHVDVRVISATHRDLHAEARRGRFRSDLLYRLAVVRVCLPPLRARPDDVALIVERLIGKALAPGDQISGRNLELLMSYSWPGNVRELRNVLQRAVALSGRQPGSVRFTELAINLGTCGESPATLGYTFPGVNTALSYKDAKQQLMSQFEAEYIQALMRRHAGNITQVANAAGLSRKHVYELLRRMGLSDSDG